LEIDIDSDGSDSEELQKKVAEAQKYADSFISLGKWVHEQAARGNVRYLGVLTAVGKRAESFITDVKDSERNMRKTWPTTAAEQRASKVTMGSQLPT
jgi:hypothetical protein